MKLRTTLAGLVTIAMFVFLLTPSAFAQVGASNAQVNGVVHDESGGSVARANVVLRETETNRTYTAVSNDNGLFVVTNLPPGRYELTTEASGFGRATQTGILLTVGQVAAIEVVVKVAASTEKICAPVASWGGVTGAHDGGERSGRSISVNARSAPTSNGTSRR